MLIESNKNVKNIWVSYYGVCNFLELNKNDYPLSDIPVNHVIDSKAFAINKKFPSDTKFISWVTVQKLCRLCPTLAGVALEKKLHQHSTICRILDEDTMTYYEEKEQDMLLTSFSELSIKNEEDDIYGNNEIDGDVNCIPTKAKKQHPKRVHFAIGTKFE